MGELPSKSQPHPSYPDHPLRLNLGLNLSRRPKPVKSRERTTILGENGRQFKMRILKKKGAPPIELGEAARTSRRPTCLAPGNLESTAYKRVLPGGTSSTARKAYRGKPHIKELVKIFEHSDIYVELFLDWSKPGVLLDKWQINRSTVDR